MEHSTIIYEDPSRTPLLRLAWNKQDPNYLATMAMDSTEVQSEIVFFYLYQKRNCKTCFFLKVIILDIRIPCQPVAHLNNHRACVNGLAWAPHSSCHVCTAG